MILNGTKMKKILFLSAADRLNYGDLLFPILFKKVLKKNKITVEFKNFGLVKSDLSSFGALKTKSYKKLIKASKLDNSVLIVGGGEALFPTFTTLYSYINRSFNYLLKFYKFKKLEKKYTISSKLLVSKKIKYPFTPSKTFFNNDSIKIIYNSVGGTFVNINPNDIKYLINFMNESDYVSVRDNRSYDSLTKNNIQCRLSPDSALIMSDFYSKKDLSIVSSLDVKTLPMHYYVVQIGSGKTPKNFDDFFNKLLKSSKEKGFKIVLCPIGLASGHDDFEVLSNINNQYPETVLIQPQNIFDIMLILANSKCYFGTSLHGLITAQSYNVPFFLFNKNIQKLKSYSETWMTEFCFEVDDAFDTIIKNWNFEVYKHKTENQKQLVYKNYQTMFSKF